MFNGFFVYHSILAVFTLNDCLIKAFDMPNTRKTKFGDDYLLPQNSRKNSEDVYSVTRSSTIRPENGSYMPAKIRYPTGKCPKPLIKPSSVNFSYAFLNTFYKMTQGWSRKMRVRISNENIDLFMHMIDHLNEKQTFKKARTTWKNLLISQVWLLIMVASGLLYIILMPICGFFYCSRRCCCNCCGVQRIQDNPSKVDLASNLAILIVSLAFIIAGLSVYSESIGNTINNINNLDKTVYGFSEDFTTVVYSTADNLICNFDLMASTVLGQIKDDIINVQREVYDEFKKSYGYEMMQMIGDDFRIVDKSLKNTKLSLQMVKQEQGLMGNNQLPQSVLNELSYKINVMEDDFSIFRNQTQNMKGTVHKLVFESNSKVNETLDSAVRFVNNIYNHTVEILISLNDSLSIIDKYIEMGESTVIKGSEIIKTFRFRREATYSIYAIVLLPCLLVLVPATVVVISGILHLPASDETPSKRSRIWELTGCLGLFAIYFAFFTGWIVMIAATTGFIGGFVIETVCYLLFHDKEMTLQRKLLDVTIQLIISGQKIQSHYNIGDTMRRCKDNVPFLSALKLGDEADFEMIINRTGLVEARQSAIDAFRKTNLTYLFPPEKLRRLNTSFLNFLTKVPVVTPHLKTSQPSMQYMNGNLTQLTGILKHLIKNATKIVETSVYSGAFIELGINIFKELFDKITKQAIMKANKAKEELLQETISCLPIYKLWENFGTIVCDQIGLPIQGIWASAGLAAVSFIPTIVMTTLVIKYLFRINRKSAEDQADN